MIKIMIYKISINHLKKEQNAKMVKIIINKKMTEKMK